jgi:hypothetical protein
MNPLTTWALKQIFGSNYITELTELGTTAIAQNPALSLLGLEQLADSNAIALIQKSVAKLPVDVQVFVTLVVATEQGQITAWLDGLVSQAYEKVLALAHKPVVVDTTAEVEPTPVTADAQSVPPTTTD